MPTQIDVPVVVAGELITAAGWNQIRADLIDLENTRNDFGPHQLRFVPAGNLDAGAGAYTDWLAVGNVTVPTVATAVVLVVSINRYLATTTGVPEYLLRSRVGTIAEGNPSGHTLMEVANTTVPKDITFVSYIIAPPAGLQSVAIQTSRTTGTGAIRATTSTLATVSVHFRG